MLFKRNKIIFNIHLIIGLIATIPLLIMTLAAPFASYREEIKSAINEKYINLAKLDFNDKKFFSKYLVEIFKHFKLLKH